MCVTNQMKSVVNLNSESAFDLKLWQKGKLKNFSSTPFTKTPFSEYWSDLPDVVNKHKTVDPYLFSHRMALGKYLIENTGGTQIWGEHYEQHWFWAYLAQLDWQRRSGRFEDPATWDEDEVYQWNANNPEKDVISEQSWWGYMNSMFIVATYLGAAEAGVVPRVQLKRNNLFSKDPAFLQCVDIWKEFWSGPHPKFLEKTKTCSKLDNNAILFSHIWETHSNIMNASINSSFAIALCNRLPRDDRRIGLGWCNMVELLASMNYFVLTLDALYDVGGGFLPTIRVAGNNSFEFLRTNCINEFITLKNLHNLENMSETSLKNAASFLGRVAHWKYGRKCLPVTLNTATYSRNPVKISFAVFNVITMAALPQSFMEGSIWMVVVSAIAMFSRWKF